MRRRCNNSKIITFVCAILLGMCVCMGCGERTPIDMAALTTENGTTSLGIGVESTYEELATAYRDYYVQRILDDGTFEPVPYAKPAKDEVLSIDDCELMVAGFFIDDMPVLTENLESMDVLTSNEYLNEHSVVYRFIIFTIQNNEVTDINADYLDYNYELYRD